MGGSVGDGGAAAAAAPSTAPARGASRAALLEQRKSEVQDDAAVVGSLVKVAYAEAWTTRAGAAMSSGYGKQVLKKKLWHIGGGDNSCGNPTASEAVTRDATAPRAVSFHKIPRGPDGKCHQSGTVILRGARNKSWIAVTACLCSARRAIAALHPKQAHDATPVTNTAHLKLFQCANGPGKRKE